MFFCHVIIVVEESKHYHQIPNMTGRARGAKKCSWKEKKKLYDNLKFNILSHKHLPRATSVAGTLPGVPISVLSSKLRTLTPRYRGRNRLRWPTTSSEPHSSRALCLRQVSRPQDWGCELTHKQGGRGEGLRVRGQVSTPTAY